MDAVITYVNGGDKTWISEYNKYVTKPIEEARYRDWGTLSYLIKGIRKFMPFVDKIFLVVSNVSQVPSDIDLSDVNIVYHSMIMPTKYLPCFNSCTIEMFLHNIPKLANEFIYFNDDTFVMRNMKATDFFVDGKPVLNPHLITMSQFDTFRVFQENCVNSTSLIRNKFVKTFPSNIYIRQEHIMRPMLKSTYKKVWHKCENEIYKSLTRTRHNRNYNAYLFNNYDYMTGNYVQKELNFKFIRTSDSINNIITEITSGKNDILCMNDNSEINFFNKKYIQEAFDCAVKNIPYDISDLTLELQTPSETENKTIKVALCAIAKNENLYIREWVEWYKKMGVSKIFLYDNNESNGERFEEVINDYIENGFVEIIDVRGVEKGCVYDKEGLNLQPKCYIDCYENRVKNFDWVCFFDIDEFLMFKEKWNLFNFLNQNVFDSIDTILISWEHYDDNNLLKYDSRPVVERFTHRSKYAYHGVKSIVRTNKLINDKFQSGLIHIFRLKGNKVCYSSGLRLYNNKTWYLIPDNIHNSAPCVLNHYKTKTVEEFLKRQLGRHWGTGKRYTDYPLTLEKCKDIFFKYCSHSVEKDSVFNNYYKNN